MNIQVGGNASPGMGKMLAGLGSRGSEIAKNDQMLKVLASFMGPSNMGAQQRMKQTDFLVNAVTDIPDQVKAYAKNRGMSGQEAAAHYHSIIQSISGDGAGFQQAGFGGGGFDPLNYAYSGADSEGFGLPSLGEQRQAKFEALQYISQQLANPSPEFAQEMTMAATLPIAKEMIPNTVFLKAFMTDMAIGEISKPYFLKRRYKAFQSGLGNQASSLPPSEIQTYNPMLVTPEEWERPVTIDMKYLETMNFDVAADILSDGGRELQVLIDQTAFKGLDALIPNGGAPPAAGTTTNGFVLDSTGTLMTLESGINPQIEHINYANQILRNRGYNPDLIIISPFELSTLMNQQAVLMAYAYGTREVQETGLVGTLVGNAVAWTPNLFSGGAASSYKFWVCDSDELARTVLGHPISVYPTFLRRRLEFLLYTRLNIFYRNTNAAVGIVCSNTESGIT